MGNPLKMKIVKSTATKKNTTAKKSAAKKTASSEGSTASRPVDPLYAIFEQHLFNFADPDADRKVFIGHVVADYLAYLRKNNVIVPKSLEQPIVEELGAQVNTMLVRKIYGCLTPNALDIVGRKKARPRSRASKTG
jgi:hypothetical protein